MQTLEAMISLIFFIWAATLALSSFEPQPVDDSLYRLQLAGDYWRVLYLQGRLRNISDIRSLEPALELIGDESGHCVFINGINSATNCRGGTVGHEMTVSVQRTLLVNGAPERITFSVGK